MSETLLLWKSWDQASRQTQSDCVNLGHVAGKWPQLKGCKHDGQSGFWVAMQGSFLNNNCHPMSEK